MLKFLLSIVILLSVSGCYTVIWMPEDEFPSESSYNEYYSEPYYGDYYSFYGHPWWLNFAPPSVPVGSDYIREENGSTSSLRNEGQGRGNDNTRILTTPPPSRDGSSNNNSTTTTTKSGNINSNSGNSNNNSNSNTRSSDNNSIRNNDGNRNTNSGRK
jgi:hypothetical protein